MGQRIWILRDVTACTGCRLCEIACSLKHEGTIWPAASRIKVFELEPGFPIPYMCVQCPDYPCVKACPTNALRVDEDTGAVLVDEGYCTLCRQCIVACPGNIPRIIPGRNSVIICDLCGGDPECVKACSSAGYNALKIVGHPNSELVKHYLIRPEELAGYISRKHLLRPH